MSTRRTFLAATSTAAAAALVTPSIAMIGAEPAPEGQHTLPPLPYAYDALEPHLDAQTMQLHHTKHHQAYVDGLNKAEAELAKARVSGDHSLVQHWMRQAAFHGGGHWLHSMFWKVMAAPSAGGGGTPSGELATAITESFGSFDAFKAQFTAAAKAVEGGGWALLLLRRDDKRLLIQQAENQHKLTSWGAIPVMGIDVWEHAYYLKYQNRRADYVTAWWNVVNWKQVQENYRTLAP